MLIWVFFLAVPGDVVLAVSSTPVTSTYRNLD